MIKGSSSSPWGWEYVSFPPFLAFNFSIFLSEVLAMISYLFHGVNGFIEKLFHLFFHIQNHKRNWIQELEIFFIYFFLLSSHPILVVSHFLHNGPLWCPFFPLTSRMLVNSLSNWAKLWNLNHFIASKGQQMLEHLERKI